MKTLSLLPFVSLWWLFEKTFDLKAWNEVLLIIFIIVQITWQQEGNSIEVGSASNQFDQADPCTQA